MYRKFDNYVCTDSPSIGKYPSTIISADLGKTTAYLALRMVSVFFERRMWGGFSFQYSRIDRNATESCHNTFLW